MKKLDFLNKLKNEGKLELVALSNEIKESYLGKSTNSLKAAQLLLKSGLLKEAASMAYYARYHALIALMFKCGIYTDFEVVLEDVENLITKSQDFTIKVKVIIESLTNESVETVRAKYESL